MLLRDLTIENYRSFDKYRLEGLARVNLLVGDNNCGKTSVLEAVHILIANGKLDCTLETLSNRDEIKKSFRSTKSQIIGHPAPASLFHMSKGASGHPIANIKITSTRGSEDYSVDLSIKYSIDNEPESLVSQLEIDGVPIRQQSLKLDSTGLAVGPISSPSNPLSGNNKSRSTLPVPRHVFVPSSGLKASRLSKFWSALLPTKGEQEVIEAINIVFPEIHGIQFESDARSKADIWVDTNNGRYSSSDLGGGVSFLLAIGIGAATSRSGVLFIDEIDTGLHYSRLADMWRMVIRTAKDLDVQVFATTHSSDCIRGLADAVRDEEDLISEVAIHSIDRRLEESVRYAGDELETIVRHEIEVR